mmetsp:Transcript_12018/g.18312  ORF Transcript_12018/g.18312 Transcript_12018/m.18312 type:complete len:104 (+) Transcript_12018:28-339(+)
MATKIEWGDDDRRPYSTRSSWMQNPGSYPCIVTPIQSYDTIRWVIGAHFVQTVDPLMVPTVERSWTMGLGKACEIRNMKTGCRCYLFFFLECSLVVLIAPSKS